MTSVIGRFLALFLLLLSPATYAAPAFTDLDNTSLKALLAKGVPIYDIRRPDEWYQTGVVEGSHKLTFLDGAGRLNPDFLPSFLNSVDRNQPVIVICRTGNRTNALVRLLSEKLGYTRVYNVRDGITRWIAEGNPVARN